MVGTRKGAFLALSNTDRQSWNVKGPFFKGVQVNHLTYSRSLSAILAAGKSSWWGPDIRLSNDLGQTWTEPLEGIRFPSNRGLSVERVWHIEADDRVSPTVLYAGVDPATLFRSADGGSTWHEIPALTDHPGRARWTPGAGGLMVHSICTDPRNGRRMFVGISAAGVFRTDDGGQTWIPKNKNVRADFLPEKFPEMGQCVHHLEIHPTDPDVLYQQNHCGVYRTDNAGDDWIDISEGLPSRFGFPLAVHPHDGDTLFVIPEESDQCRVTPGALQVFRSRNRGGSWELLRNGLPQSHAYQNVLRAAMTTDPLDAPGVYIGTQGGRVLASFDEGDRWTTILDWLPPIYSLETAVI